MSEGDFLQVLRQNCGQFSEKILGQIHEYRNLVLAGSQRQNLTRIIEPLDFFEGHVWDSVELLNSGFVKFPAVDLGSGVGVPGILVALLGGGPWVLVESEKRKAEFLNHTIHTLGLSSSVRVFSGRIEEFLGTAVSVGSVVARAVGSVERIYGWIRKCSTWNNLILLKGPAWQEEWARFQKTRYRKELMIRNSHHYELGAHKKERLIIYLERVG